MTKEGKKEEKAQAKDKKRDVKDVADRERRMKKAEKRKKKSRFNAISSQATAKTTMAMLKRQEERDDQLNMSRNGIRLKAILVAMGAVIGIGVSTIGVLEYNDYKSELLLDVLVSEKGYTLSDDGKMLQYTNPDNTVETYEFVRKTAEGYIFSTDEGRDVIVFPHKDAELTKEGDRVRLLDAVKDYGFTFDADAYSTGKFSELLDVKFFSPEGDEYRFGGKLSFLKNNLWYTKGELHLVLVNAKNIDAPETVDIPFSTEKKKEFEAQKQIAEPETEKPISQTNTGGAVGQ